MTFYALTILRSGSQLKCNEMYCNLPDTRFINEQIMWKNVNISKYIILCNLMSKSPSPTQPRFTAIVPSLTSLDSHLISKFPIWLLLYTWITFVSLRVELQRCCYSTSNSRRRQYQQQKVGMRHSVIIQTCIIYRGRRIWNKNKMLLYA